MKGAFLRLADWRLLRYGVASAVALATDLTIYFLTLALGVWPTAAAAASYGAGIVVHWILSSRAVFGSGVAPAGLARTRQKAQFVGSALVGLVLTTAIVWLGKGVGSDPRIAKLSAVCISFGVTWLLRNRIVFRRPASIP